MTSEEPTLGELGRAVAALRQEYRESSAEMRAEFREGLVDLQRLMTAYVLREVYEAQWAALQERLAADRETTRQRDADHAAEIAALRAAREEDHKAARTANRNAALSLVVGVVLFVLQLSIKSKGG